ncbi:hypothetical protein QQ054_29675 [Oscillatoria amoena NRMC-F 0135]|nr:hypothetical protein [Oscillatoria amoena NRMC-F 0135]
MHLDTLQDGRQFIEIEAIDPANRFTEADLQHQCLSMKTQLGIADSDLVQTGYMAS